MSKNLAYERQREPGWDAIYVKHISDPAEPQLPITAV